MTIFLNVTDAISSASHHGITRTERQLAAALVGTPGVEFVTMHGGSLWQATGDQVTARLRQASPETVPSVERFGVDPVPRSARRLRHVGQRFRALGSRGASGFEAVRLVRPNVVPGDVLVSVGLDWVHGLVEEAECWVLGHGARYVGFCYDMIPVDHPEWLFPPDPLGFLEHFERVTRIASSMLCISESTRRDFLRHLPEYGAERVHVIRLGADAAVTTRPEHHRFAESLFDGEPYAVYCATIDRRKNHQLLYRAVKEMARSGRSANIAFVGKVGSGVDDLLDSLRHDDLVAGRVAHVTNCDDRHLAAIYRRARFAVYPSLYEGWGLGVTEALAHGTPCLVATGSSLGEAGLGVCRELHPLRTSDWVEAMDDYFHEPPPLPPFELPTWAAAADSLVDLVSV